MHTTTSTATTVNAATPKARIIALLLATALGLTAACDDPTELDTHPDVEGFTIVETTADGTTELYRYLLDDGAAPQLDLELRSFDVTFQLLDQDGQPLADEHEEEGHGAEEHLEVEITVEDPSILTWAEGDEHRSGTLTALKAGTTTLTLCVPHGDHCELEVDVPVVVN